MKRIDSRIAIVFVALLVCGWLFPVNARAQEDLGFQAAISFPFSIDNQLLDAGVYRFELPRDSFLLAVHKLNTNKTYFLDVRPEIDSPPASRGSLTFHRDGDYSYLIAIHFAGTGYYSVPISIGPASSNRSMAGLSSGSRLSASR